MMITWLDADLGSNGLSFGFKYFSVLYSSCLVNLSLQGGADGQRLYFWDHLICSNTPGKLSYIHKSI